MRIPGNPLPTHGRSHAFRKGGWALAGILAVLGGLQATALVHRERSLRAQALEQGAQEARRLAEAVEASLGALEPEVRSLAADLSSGRVPDPDLPGRLDLALARVPAAFSVGVAYAPDPRTPGAVPAAPWAERGDGGPRHYLLGDHLAYPAQNWFQEALTAEGWHEPRVSQPSGQLTVGYSRFVRRPGDPAGAPVGIVHMDIPLARLRQILAATRGRAGYALLVTGRGTFLAHPRQDWVTDQRTLFQVAREAGDPDLWRCGELAARSERGVVETVSYLGDQPIWLLSEPVRSTPWTLEAAVFRSDGALGPVAKRRAIIDLSTTVMAIGACLGLALMGAVPGALQALWRWQALVSSLLALEVGLLWGLTLAYPDPQGGLAAPIRGREQVEAFLATHGPGGEAGAGRGRRLVPTGIFLQTLRFEGASDVVATGLAWQRFPADFPAELQRGFRFPNAEVQETRENFRRKDGRGELVEYRFSARLRQDFSRTAHYPFDQAVIRLPLWPIDFDAQVALVPDLDAYHVLDPASLPGLEKGLVLPGWNLETSSFGFRQPAYATSFGLPGETAADLPPELCFQLILSRKFLDPFISALLPVLVVCCLLFILLLVVTKEEDKVQATGFKAINFLPGTASLLFPVLYAQISLRSRLASSSLLYLEYFYFVAYAAILMVAANVLAFSLGKSGLVHQQDNAVAKLLYWPLVLGAFFVISLLFLY
jgi:hypothetical protein